MSASEERSPEREGESPAPGESTTPQHPVAPLHTAETGKAPVPPPAGLTLEAYAAGKALDHSFLRGLGLRAVYINGTPTLKIPYLGVDGGEVATRFRPWLEEGEGPKFTWRRGATPQPYGQERLGDAREAGFVLLVEGESDAHTLWQHGFPALGIPGARAWNEDRDAPLLDGIEWVYVVIEPDSGGEAVMAWLERSSIRDRALLVTFDEQESR